MKKERTNKFIKKLKDKKIPSGATQQLIHDFKKKIYNVQPKLHFKSKNKINKIKISSGATLKTCP